MDLLTPDFGVFFWQSIILFVVIFLLGKFAWKPALQTIRNRENFIADSLFKAEERNRRVAKVEDECFELIKNANDEKNKILQEAAENRKTILDNAEIAAKNLSEKIIGEVEESMIQYRLQTIQNSKEEIITLSIDIAEKMVKRELAQSSKSLEYLNGIIDKELNQRVNNICNESF